MQGRAKTQGKEKRAKIEFLVAGNFESCKFGEELFTDLQQLKVGIKLAIYLGEKFKLVLCRHCLRNRV